MTGGHPRYVLLAVLALPAVPGLGCGGGAKKCAPAYCKCPDGHGSLRECDTAGKLGPCMCSQADGSAVDGAGGSGDRIAEAAADKADVASEPAPDVGSETGVEPLDAPVDAPVDAPPDIEPDLPIDAPVDPPPVDPPVDAPPDLPPDLPVDPPPVDAPPDLPPDLPVDAAAEVDDGVTEAGDAPDGGDGSAGDAGDGGDAGEAGDGADAADASDAPEAGPEAPIAVWTERTVCPLGPSWPPPRHFYRLAFDEDRGRAILFGGTDSSAYFADVWEWNGAASVWTDRTPCAAGGPQPAPRANPGVAFDLDRGKLVVFGGEISGAPVAAAPELWEWDSGDGTWSDRTPVMLPPEWPTERISTVMTYDVARKKVVMFGGRTYDGSYMKLRDLWEWDGLAGTWTNRTPLPIPSAWPAARAGAGLAYDPDRSVAILYGGTSPSGTDLWEWDGGAGMWTDRTPAMLPAVWPPSRSDLAFTYDSGRMRALLSGGLGTTVALNDTWEWNGTDGTWEDRTDASSPPLAGHALAYDPGAGKAVTLRGSEALPVQSSDTWEWDGTAATWSDATPAARPLEQPLERWGFGAVYDEGRSALLVFGGYARGRSTLEWDPVTRIWSDRTPAAIPVSWPTARYGVAMVYDATVERVFMFGGREYDSNLPLDELWEWNGAAGTWTDRTPVSPPAAWPEARDFAAMSFEPVRGKALLFGGGDDSTRMNDAWELTGSAYTWADWTASPLPASWPGKRYRATLAYAGGGKMLLVGGNPDGTTWLRDDTTGAWTKPAGGPTVTFGAAAYHAARDRAVVWSGPSYEFAGATSSWALLPAAVSPATRTRHVLVHDSGRSRSIMFGGLIDDSGYTDDLWELEIK